MLIIQTRLFSKLALNRRIDIKTASVRPRILLNKNAGLRTLSTSPILCSLITPDNINQNVKNLEYAVRGPLVVRAGQLDQELKAGAKKPFKSIIRANIGDCHATGQRPITFFRQVLACAADNSLLKSPAIPDDVKDKVRELLAGCGGQSVGAYSDSCGVEIVRHHIAEYIQQRDNGVPSDWKNVFLSTGASESVKSILSLINYSRKPNLRPGVMIPIPQYPLYSATLCEYGMHQVNYYLDEHDEWSLKIEELERSYVENVNKCDLRAIVVINPGNPTGSVLSAENIQQVIDFAQRHDLMILADEVYQQNVYGDGSQFHSFKKILNKMGAKVELASTMSASKGYMGECGLRAGYCEITNFTDEVRALLFKALSARLCSSVLGQFVMDCIVAPPKPGQTSYELFVSERDQILSDLKRKSTLVADTFNSVPGVSSNKVAGAMYAFPRLNLPKKAIEAAESAQQKPDFFYAMNLLEETGICVVPGSGFGQLPGTHHFRTTILPQLDMFEEMMGRFKQFHGKFMSHHN